ncbi:MAG: 16S rRNA (guanine(966)-N(2))-methyltransferase RsmD [Gammaproteobacteria bacterium]|jgi:16S rRNA (guanine966-N2)-methyltransferase
MRPNRPVNQLRIIAGDWRGRKLVFAPVPGLRPTADRIRETLFNWLSPVVDGACCLDLYAGSGALGFEAASRGAAGVVLVENSPVVARTLRDQRNALDASQVKVIEADVDTWLQGRPEPFDIVFLDPPFHENRLPGCLRKLEQSGWLAAGAWIYIEAERGLVLELPESWEPYRSKHAGNVDYYLMRRTAG